MNPTVHRRGCLQIIRPECIQQNSLRKPGEQMSNTVRMALMEKNVREQRMMTLIFQRHNPANSSHHKRAERAYG